MVPGDRATKSEQAELFLYVSLDSLLLNSDNVESDGLGEGSALSNSDDITGSHSAVSWGAVSVKGMMSLLESVVFLDVMQVISPDND